MKTTVLILNWNTLPSCRAQLRSMKLAGVEGVSVTVIDNHSSEPGVESLADEYPGLDLMRLNANTGFTGGFNRGVEKALKEGAELVVLLNPDLVFVENPFPAIEELMKTDSSVGVVSPAIYNDRECRDLYCLGWDFSSLSQPFRVRKGVEEKVLFPDAVLGCFMAIRREVFERGIFFDERFYNYYEEADFCLRVRAAGYKIAALPQTKICHTRYAATGAYSPLKSYYQGRNLVLFCRKHALFGTAYFHMVHGLWDHLRQAGRISTPTVRVAVRKALKEGFWDGLLGRFGRARRYLAQREQDPTLKGM